MQARRSTFAGVSIAVTLAVLALAWAALPAKGQRQLPMEPLHESGQSVTGAFEGWFKNADGSFSLLAGYFNRNLKEELDIDVGPNNRIEPGGPDRGQPTHFLPRRQWGVFRIIVPKDFGSNKLNWTLVANHQTTVIPLSLDPLWEISPFSEASMGNTPPVLKFGQSGPTVQGPLAMNISLTATVGSPLTLTAWVEDDAKVLPGSRNVPKTPPATLWYSKFRGPGEVTFDKDKPPIEKEEGSTSTAKFSGKATTTAKFSAPGDYVLLVVANDWSGDGGRGFQCCWTTGQVKVTVKP